MTHDWPSSSTAGLAVASGVLYYQLIGGEDADVRGLFIGVVSFAGVPPCIEVVFVLLMPVLAINSATSLLSQACCICWVEVVL